MRAVLLIVALFVALVPGVGSAQYGCTFQLGFRAIYEQVPDLVGPCLENEHFNVTNGNAEQRTTAWHGKGGLLVWRKSDNWTAFTDGSQTWVNGPYGLQKRANTERFSWEAQEPSQPTAAVVRACFVEIEATMQAYPVTYGWSDAQRAGLSSQANQECQRLTMRDGNPGFNCYQWAFAGALGRVGRRAQTSGAQFAADIAELYAGCAGKAP